MNPTDVTKSRYSAPVGQVGGAIANGMITQDGVTPLSSGISSEPVSAGIVGTVKPLSLPDISTSSTAQGLSGLADGVKQSALDQQLKADELAKTNAKTASQNDFSNTVKSILDVQTGRGQAETAAGLDKKAIAATDATNKLEASQRAQTNELRAIESNTALTKDQAVARTTEVNRKYAFEQADLALLQSAANRDYATAQSIVDRKIELQLEPLKTKLDYYKQVNADNREDLTKAQQNTLSNLEKSAQNEYNTAQSNSKSISDFYSKAVESGQPELVTALSKLNPASPTFVTDLGKVVSNLSGNTVDRQIKQAQLEELQAKAKSIGVSLPAAVQTKVQTIAGQFDSETAVKNYQAIAESIDAVRNAGTSPTDDIQRIYAVAKVLDPSSAVKEGEYKTIEAYAQSLLQRTGKKIERVFDNDGFLTEEARSFINTTLDNRLASSEKAYKNIYSEYGRRIDKVTGNADGTQYITDYSRAFGQTPAQALLNSPVPTETTPKPYSPDVWSMLNLKTP